MKVVEGVRLPPWACWMLTQSPTFRELLDQAYAENLYLHQVLSDVRTVALEWRAEQIDPESGLMKADAVAAQIGLTSAAIRKAARQGRLVGVKQGSRGDWMFRRADVRAFAATRNR